MAGFNLNATLNLALSKGAISTIKQQILSGLSGVNVPVNLTFPGFGQLTQELARVTAQAAAAGTSLSNLAARANTASTGVGGLAARASVAGAEMGNLATRANAAGAGVGTLGSRANAAGAGVGSFGARVVAAGAGVGALGARAVAAGVEVDAFAARLRAAGTGASSFSAKSIAAGVGLGSLTVAIRAGLTEAIKFDNEMVRLAQVSSEPSTAVRGLATDITRLSTSLGTSSLTLAQTAVTLKQSGLSLSETRTALDAIAKASLSPTFEGGAKQITEMAIAARQFGVDAKSLEGALGSVNAVAAAFAVESGDLAKAISNAGGSAAAARVSMNELLGLFTAIRDTTRESPDQIATGLRTTFARLARGDTVDSLKTLGIELRRTRKEAVALGEPFSEGQFVGGFEAVKRISTALANVQSTDPRFSQIVERLGGYRQISRVIPLLKQFEKAQRAVAVAQAGQGSVAIAAEQAQDAYAVRLEKIKEQLLAVGRAALESRGFSLFVDLLEKGASAATQLARAIAPLLPLLAGVAAFRGLGALGLVPSLTRGRVAAGVGFLGAGVVAPALLGENSRAGGALQGAAAGALAGLTFGPWVAAIGAAVGALAGFRSAVLSSREALQSEATARNQTGIANSLTDLKAGAHPTAAATLNGYLAATRKDIDSAATEGAYVRDPLFGYAVGELRPERYASERSRRFRTTLGPQLINFAGALHEQAQRAGQAAPDDDATTIAGRVQRQNAQLVSTISELNGVSVADTIKTLIDSIRAGQTAAKTGALQLRQDQTNIRAAASLGRLADAAESAGKALSPLSQRNAALAAFAEGNVARPSAIDATNPGTLRGLVAPLGIGGASLLEKTRAAKNLKDVLPAVIAEISAGGGLDTDTVGIRLREGVTRALGGRLSRSQSAGLDSVVDRASRKDTAEFLRSAADPSGFADELLKEFAGPTKEAAERLAKEYERQSERISDGLSFAANRLREIGADIDRTADLRLGAVRADAAIRSDALGGGDPTRFLSTAQLLSPFNARQSRLLAGTGLRGDDVGGIASRLGEAREQITAATVARDAAQGTRAALAFAERLSGLSQQANNLQTALKNLADPVQRAAALQERLNSLNADRDSRLGFAERFLLADPSERFRLARGQVLAAQLNQDPTRFRQLSDSDRKLALQAARDLGNAQFANGRTGQGLLNALLEQTGVLNPASERERRGIIGEQSRIAQQAVATQGALNGFSQDTVSAFLGGLRQQQSEFFARLERLLLSGRLADARVRVGTAAGNLRDVQELARQRAVVQSQGFAFASAEDAKRLQTYRPLLSEYVTERDAVRSLEQQRVKLRGVDFVGAIAPDVADLQNVRFSASLPNGLNDKLAKALVDRGVSGEASKRILDETDLRLSQAVKSKSSDELTLEVVRKTLANSLSQAINTEFLKAISEKSAPASAKAAQLQAGLTGKVDLERLTPAGLTAVDKALEVFGRAGNSLDALDQRLDEAVFAFERATAAVRELESAARGSPQEGAVYRAAGGLIPRGTDRVPAMLSPGEFIVNARSASANPLLLEQINAARGPVYLADGGPVSELFFQRTRDGARGAAAYGYYKPEDVDAITSRVLLRREARRQVQSLQAEEAYAAAGLGIAAQSTRDSGEFYRDQFGRNFGGFIAGAFQERAERRRQDAIAQTEQRRALRERYRDGSPLWGRSSIEPIVPGRQDWLDQQARQRLIDEARRRENLAKFQQEKAHAGDVNARRDDLDRAPLGLPIYGTVQEQRERAWARRFADGGYISGGVPGRDSVPALLMPGEFVLRKKAVQAVGADQLRQVNRMADGGPVGSNAPTSPAGIGFPGAEELTKALMSFNQPATNLATALNTFGPSSERLATALERMPTEVNHQGKFDMVVVLNGDSALNALAQPLKELVLSEIQGEISKEFDRRLPELGSPVRSDARQF